MTQAMIQSRFCAGEEDYARMRALLFEVVDRAQAWLKK
jgi:hypothetical protein